MIIEEGIETKENVLQGRRVAQESSPCRESSEVLVEFGLAWKGTMVEANTLPVREESDAQINGTDPFGQ